MCTAIIWLHDCCTLANIFKYEYFAFSLKRVQQTTTCLQYIQQKHVPKTRSKWMRGHLHSTVQNAMATLVYQTKTSLCFRVLLHTDSNCSTERLERCVYNKNEYKNKYKREKSQRNVNECWYVITYSNCFRVVFIFTIFWCGCLRLQTIHSWLSRCWLLQWWNLWT